MRWNSLAEHQILKAKTDGQLDGLPGEGKPLTLRPGEDIVSVGLGIMANAGVLPNEIVLKKAVEKQSSILKKTTDPTRRKEEMRRLADLQLRLGIEQDARRKFYKTT